MNISHGTVTVSELCRWGWHGLSDTQTYLGKSWHLLRYQYQSDRSCIPRIQAQGTYTPKLGTGIMTNGQERDADTPERCIDSFLYYFFFFWHVVVDFVRCLLSISALSTHLHLLWIAISSTLGVSLGGGMRELWQCPLFYILTYL